MSCIYYISSQQHNFYSFLPVLIEIIKRAMQSPIPVGEATEIDYSEYLAAVKESQ